jgi:hypothetical protein
VLETTFAGAFRRVIFAVIDAPTCAAFRAAFGPGPPRPAGKWQPRPQGRERPQGRRGRKQGRKQANAKKYAAGGY